MPRPYLVRLVIKVLEQKGFYRVSQNGSHVKFRHNDQPVRTVIVPIHEKEIRYGTFRSILRQAKLTEEDFQKKH